MKTENPKHLEVKWTLRQTYSVILEIGKDISFEDAHDLVLKDADGMSDSVPVGEHKVMDNYSTDNHCIDHDAFYEDVEIDFVREEKIKEKNV